VLRNWVLRKLFGLKREEVTGALNKLQNEELHDWYHSGICYLGDHMKRDEMDGTCGTY